MLDGARILGEKENLVAGLSGSFTLTLQPGEYTLQLPRRRRPRRPACSPSAARPSRPSTDPQLQAAVTGYSRYVHTQAVTLRHANVRSFVAARQGGRRREGQGAVRRGARSRTRRSSRSPRASATSIPSIDARVNDVEPGQKWTGFHRDRAGAVGEAHDRRAWRPIADKLLADVQDARGQDAHARLPAGRARQRRERAAGRGRLVEDHRRGGPLLAHRPVGLPRPTSTARRRRSALLAPALRSAKDPKLADDIAARFDAVQKELATLGDRRRRSRATPRSTTPSASS